MPKIVPELWVCAKGLAVGLVTQVASGLSGSKNDKNYAKYQNHLAVVFDI
jgi:hypothetical protein